MFVSCGSSLISLLRFQRWVELSIAELSIVELLLVACCWLFSEVLLGHLGSLGVRGRSVVYHLSEIQLETFWGRLFKFYNNLLVC